MNVSAFRNLTSGGASDTANSVFGVSGWAKDAVDCTASNAARTHAEAQKCGAQIMLTGIFAANIYAMPCETAW
jgi:hypothetical protein